MYVILEPDSESVVVFEIEFAPPITMVRFPSNETIACMNNCLGNSGPGLVDSMFTSSEEE